jgi:hypothetical protein
MLHANKLVGVYGYPGSGNVLFERLIRSILQLEPFRLSEPYMHDIVGDYMNLQQSFFRHVARTLRDDVKQAQSIISHFETLRVNIPYKAGHLLRIGFVPCHMALQAPFLSSHTPPHEQDIRTMQDLGYHLFLVKRHPLETLLSTASKATKGTSKAEQALDNPDWLTSAANWLCSWYEQVLPFFPMLTVVAYEDITRGPEYLHEFARQIGATLSDKEIDSIWEQYGFKPLVPGSKRHFWKGGSGKWKTYFQPQHLRTLNDIGFFTLFPKLGYELPDQIEEVNPDRSSVQTGSDILLGAIWPLKYAYRQNCTTEASCGNKHTIHIYAAHPNSLEEATRLAEDARELLEKPGWNELLGMVAP